jgi:hypothetical protein
MRSRREKVLLAIGLAGSALAAFLIQRGLSGLSDALLGNYEVDLPPWLRLVLTYHQAIWVLPLLVLLAWVAWPQQRWRGAVACTLGLGMFAFSLMSYLPFFKVAVTL